MTRVILAAVLAFLAATWLYGRHRERVFVAQLTAHPRPHWLDQYFDVQWDPRPAGLMGKGPH